MVQRAARQAPRVAARRGEPRAHCDRPWRRRVHRRQTASDDRLCGAARAAWPGSARSRSGCDRARRRARLRGPRGSGWRARPGGARGARGRREGRPRAPRARLRLRHRGRPAGTLFADRATRRERDGPRLRLDRYRSARRARGHAHVTDSKLIVVAFGGNAVYPPTIKGTAQEQLDIMADACEHLVPMFRAGSRVVITHGNGPVVGNILSRMALTSRELVPMPMDVCVAHSQGGIGYMLQQSLANVLARRGIPLGVSSIVTEVEVAADDPAFANPTKPVGRFFSEADAKRIGAETGWDFVEDSGRGWRRVVPSPMPLKILDAPAINALLAAGMVPIAAGGGGIPVVRQADGTY